MALPSKPEVFARARELDINPIDAFAYAAMMGRVPSDLFEFQYFYQIVKNWMMKMGADRAEWYVFIYGYIQSHGALPFTIDNMRQWMQSKGFVTSADQPTGKVPLAGEDYIGPSGGIPSPVPPPQCAGGTVWDAAQGKCVPIGGGTPGGIFDSLTKWAIANPIAAAAVGMGLFLVMGKRR